MLHEHPIKILRYTAKNLWLLIFPLLRSAHFFPFSAKEIAAWLHGSWFDLLICVLILTYGAIRWYFCGFMYNTEVIRRQSGILLKRETEIPCSSITSVTEEHAFFLRPFGAVRVSIHTGAEDIAGADMQLVLYKIWLLFGKSFRCCDLLQTSKCIDRIRPDCCYFRFSSPVAYLGQFMQQRFFFKVVELPEICSKNCRQRNFS